MHEHVLIGFDIGSSNVKLVLFDETCAVLANETSEYQTIVPRAGWTEYNPQDWWQGFKQTLHRALTKSCVDVNQISGIGLSSLGCCPILLDREGNCLYNGIPWSDHRADREVEAIIESCGEKIFSACRNYPSTLNVIPHLLWIKNNRPEIYEKSYKFLEPSAFLAYRLTGEMKLDVSFASCCSFGFDVDKLNWNQALIEQMGLDSAKFPTLHANTDCIGFVSQRAAAETGLKPGIPVFSGGPDFSPGALAAGILKSGQGYYSMGSGSNIIVTTDHKDVASKSLLSTIHIKGWPLRILSGVQGSIGYSYRWFRDQLSGIECLRAEEEGVDVFEIMSSEAQKVQPGSGGVIFIPHLFGKFHPVFNAHAKGMFCGISSLTTRAQLIRAVMEGCCFDMYESMEQIHSLGLAFDEIIVTGGPSKSDTWCQIIADVSGKQVVTVNAPEAAPFGDAILAGVGVGIFSSFEDVAQTYISRNRVYIPNPQSHALYRKLYRVYKDLYERTIPCFDELARIYCDETQ